jgi:hypothetical protein
VEVEVEVEWEGKRVVEVERDSSGRCCVRVGRRETVGARVA